MNIIKSECNEEYFMRTNKGEIVRTFKIGFAC